eukprot:COSAG02_NODE_6938_length_3275_cov_104.393302_2_plen_71_part_00
MNSTVLARYSEQIYPEYNESSSGLLVFCILYRQPEALSLVCPPALTPEGDDSQLPRPPVRGARTPSADGP